jgi:uncharacterized protein YciI
MKFIVTAYDHPDALERRLANREQHIACIERLKQEGHMLLGGPLLNDDGQMVGSLVVCEFASKEEIQAKWFSQEPFMTNQVWETVRIETFQIGPSFAHVFS